MNEDGVIFLIDSRRVNKDLLRMSLEKLTNCKVFNFFSFEEAVLYLKLNPTVILYSETSEVNISHLAFPKHIQFINLSKKINQEGKEILLRHAASSERLVSLLTKNFS